jgi:hypothetical protein
LNHDINSSAWPPARATNFPIFPVRILSKIPS